MKHKLASKTQGVITKPWIHRHIWTVVFFIINVIAAVAYILPVLNPELKEHPIVMTLAFPIWGPFMMLLLFFTMFCPGLTWCQQLPGASVSLLSLIVWIVSFIYPTVLGILIDRIRK